MGECSALPAFIPPSWQGKRGVSRLAWLVLSIFASLAGIIVAQAGNAPPPPVPGLEGRAAVPRLVVEWRGDRLSVRVHEVPWEDMLPALERHTGVQIQVKGPLAGALTQAFEALPLEQGLRQLFRGADTVFFYEGASAGVTAGRLTRIWLWPREGRAVEEAQLRPGTGEIPPAGPDAAPPSGSRLNGPPATGAAEGEREEHPRALDALVHRGDEGDLRQALFDPDQTVQEQALTLLVAWDRQGTIDFLRDMAKTGEPTERVQALALLHEYGQADEPTILPILHEALADVDSSVKSYAIQALADRGGDEAVEALQLALRDPDPAVRLQVIDHVAPQDQGLALLQEAFADDDATVRSVAAARPEEAISEGR